MQKILIDIVKTAAIMFSVGILLAVASPFIADAIGPDLLTQAVVDGVKDTSVLWQGAFFGTFGAINAALTPLIAPLFSSGSSSNEVAVAKEKSTSITINLEPEQAKELTAAVSSVYRDRIKAEQRTSGTTIGRG